MKGVLGWLMLLSMVVVAVVVVVVDTHLHDTRKLYDTRSKRHCRIHHTQHTTHGTPLHATNLFVLVYALAVLLHTALYFAMLMPAFPPLFAAVGLLLAWLEASAGICSPWGGGHHVGNREVLCIK